MLHEQARLISLDRLVNEYNDAIETIWLLQHRPQEQLLKNEHLWKTYEELADELHR